MTKKKIEIAFARLDRLGLGNLEVNEGTINPRGSVRRRRLLTSVLPVPPFDPVLTPSSVLDWVKCGLQGVLGRVEAVGYTENDEDVHIVSKLMDDIWDPVIHYQVSDIRTNYDYGPPRSGKTGSGGASTGDL